MAVSHRIQALAPVFSIPRITSRHNPAVKRLRLAARGELPDRLLLEGEHLVRAALDAGVPIELMAVTARRRDEWSTLVARAASHGAVVVEMASSVMDAASPVDSPSGIVAIALSPAAQGESLLDASGSWIVVATDIQDPGNVGAIVRVAEAAGARGVWFTGHSASPFSWKAVRGSMGSALRLPMARTASLPDAVAACRARGARIVATAPDAARSMDEACLTGPLVLVVGGEGAGLPRAVLDDADERIRIPMDEPVESLNVATAVAVLAYAVRRQRSAGPV